MVEQDRPLKSLLPIDFYYNTLKLGPRWHENPYVS